MSKRRSRGPHTKSNQRVRRRLLAVSRWMAAGYSPRHTFLVRKSYIHEVKVTDTPTKGRQTDCSLVYASEMTKNSHQTVKFMVRATDKHSTTACQDHVKGLILLFPQHTFRTRERGGDVVFVTVVVVDCYTHRYSTLLFSQSPHGRVQR